MKINLSISNFILIVILTIPFFILTSCYKEKDTLAIVTVLNSSENPVNGASVRLFYQDSTGLNTSLIDIQENTLNDGTVTFDFTDSYKEGQAGFAVLDIEVNGSFKGVIMIEEMKTNKKTVYL